MADEFAGQATDSGLLHTRATVPGDPLGSGPAPQLAVDIDILEGLDGLYANQVIGAGEVASGRSRS